MTKESYLTLFIVLSLILSYLIGSIPTAKIIASRHGVDITKEGSKNAGGTNVGRVMQENLRNIQIMEKSMNASLQSIASGEEGAFTMGISTSRASVILPDVLKEYYALYPKSL